MKGLTLVCIATAVVAASQAMTTIIAPISEMSTTSSPSTTTTINPLLERRINSEITRLTRVLQSRIGGLQTSSSRLDRHISYLQGILDYNNAVIAQLPELIKNILISNPNRRLSSRTILRLMERQQNEMSSGESAEVEDRRRRDIFGVTSSFIVVQGTTDSTVTTQMPEITTQEVETTTGMETTAVPEVTSAATESTMEMTTQGVETTTVMETTAAPEVTSAATESPTEMTTQGVETTTVMETTAAPEVTSAATESTTDMTTQRVETTTVMDTTAAPEVTSAATESTTDMTTQRVETTTVMDTTAAPEVTSTATEATTEMTTQGTTLPPFLVRRINAILFRIRRFFQRRVLSTQRSLSRLIRFRPLYRRLIDENTSALKNLPLLVRDLVTSPFQRRLRLSQVFAALRSRLANTTTPSQSDVSPPITARKRREAESAEVDDDLVGDVEDLNELEQEVQKALEEVEQLED